MPPLSGLLQPPAAVLATGLVQLRRSALRQFRRPVYLTGWATPLPLGRASLAARWLQPNVMRRVLVPRRPLGPFSRSSRLSGVTRPRSPRRELLLRSGWHPGEARRPQWGSPIRPISGLTTTTLFFWRPNDRPGFGVIVPFPPPALSRLMAYSRPD